MGKRQHYLLGSQLREEMVPGFLSTHYNPEEMHIYSSYSNRTIESAESQMTGLYPFGTGEKLSSHQETRAELSYYKDKNKLGEEALPNAFQPIPIHVIGAGGTKDHLIRGYSTKNCPAI